MTVDDSFSVWGAGFKPGEFVTISASGVSNGDNLIGGPANEFGALSMTVDIDFPPGTYTLEAKGELGSIATAPLAIVSGK